MHMYSKMEDSTMQHSLSYYLMGLAMFIFGIFAIAAMAIGNLLAYSWFGIFTPSEADKSDGILFSFISDKAADAGEKHLYKWVSQYMEDNGYTKAAPDDYLSSRTNYLTGETYPPRRYRDIECTSSSSEQLIYKGHNIYHLKRTINVKTAYPSKEGYDTVKTLYFTYLLTIRLHIRDGFTNSYSFEIMNTQCIDHGEKGLSKSYISWKR